MMMTRRQASRFEKLFLGLCRYVGHERDLGELWRDGRLDDDVLEMVIEEIWSGEGDPGLIDAYLKDNPNRLNRTDQREVEQWKHGLLTDFIVSRIGTNVLFACGDCVFAIRGGVGEVDELVEELPCMAYTVILPFDGIITYGILISSRKMAFSADQLAMVDSYMEIARSAGRFASTSRQYARLECEAREFIREYEARGEAPEQHVGTLAGLSWEDRQRTIDDEDVALKERFAEALREVMEESCLPGKPTSSLEGILRRADLDTLAGYALTLGHYPSGDDVSRDELVDAIVGALSESMDDTMEDIACRGGRTIRDVRRVFEAGGRLDVRMDTVSLSEVVLAYPPLLVSFNVKGTVSSMIPDEAMEALADVDFDALERLLGEVDEITAAMTCVLEFRGVMREQELIGAVMSWRQHELSADQLGRALSIRAASDSLDFDLFDLEGVSYCAYFGVSMDSWDVMHDDETVDMGRVLDLMSAHERFDPRPAAAILEDFGDADTLHLDIQDWLHGKEEVRRLVTYFDAHVPATANDLYFADKVVEGLLMTIQQGRADTDVMQDLFDALEILGWVPTDEQVGEVTELLQGFYNAIPQWELNGWAPMEAAAHQAKASD